MPSTVVQSNDTGVPLPLLSETGNLSCVVPEWPSITDAGPTVITGPESSLMIVPTPCGTPMRQPDAFESFMRKNSFASLTTSPYTSALTGLLVSPAAKLIVPPPDAKSGLALVAVLSAVAKSTLAGRPLGALNDTTNVIVALPELPSACATLLIVTTGERSSFVIVASANDCRPSDAPEGDARMSENVSFASYFVSPWTTTFTVPLVWPAVSVSVPVSAS